MVVPCPNLDTALFLYTTSVKFESRADDHDKGRNAHRGRSPVVSVTRELPRFGRPGSRSAELHTGPLGEASSSETAPSMRERNRFEALRVIGLTGTFLIALGGLGGGALPVVDASATSFASLPLGAWMGRMMLASSSLALVGVAFLVFAWLLMGAFVGAGGGPSRVAAPTLLRTLGAWILPLIFTAPLFTQDIYSYLAQGAIVARGLDPYSAGPVELLGHEDPLARSVPFIWAESPSPYGPVALGISSVISRLTGTSIFWGVICHRLIALIGLAAAAWAIVTLARRCGVNRPAAVWLGALNPLVVLHLVGGIHNEAVMMGFLLVGLELGLRGIDRLGGATGWGLLVASGILISCAGMVKVTGFLALGFVGMALARRWGGLLGIAGAIAVQTTVMVVSIAAATALTGIGLGWVSGQGGAATIRSWLSLTTDVGVISAFIGQLLGLGDHSEAALVVTRTCGLLIAAGFILRMLWATYKGTIHPVGGLGVSTLVLVLLFPVVHPWYPLWGIMPLAAWADRAFFRAGTAAYCALFSFVVLPRGLALPPAAVATIYVNALLAVVAIAACAWAWFRIHGQKVLH